MSIGTVALLIAGLVGLVAGAEALVRGAARLAARTGMSSVVIGLTVVAFGTSAPELAVSVGDALRGGDEAGSIAIGKDADLVLFNAHPLSTFAVPSTVEPFGPPRNT